MSDTPALLPTLERIAERLDARPHLLRMGALFSETVLMEIDDDCYYLTFHRGRIEKIAHGRNRKTPWRFAIRTDADALERFWQVQPAPGFHDLFGLVKLGRASIDGDILSLVKNLRFFKELLAIPREEERA
ncbi:hypothetical protein [Phyllobacterium sp. YR531]|uniref:hypothetical protein n=1 Tax=Phyllobacterium sp. YR531 TaxID=1144343 RepID=UPI00026FBA81|nr:hypothetical protein [Phyllobacterium sp. YR531]EJN05851.1 hypothetical protein PMI41_00642 [Phyllobacterium sp. YR531]